ncbi:hypothetical protein HAX54_027970, partial [Datura stramonium]|nr:hypothetical protein [Datura stramonium]
NEYDDYDGKESDVRQLTQEKKSNLEDLMYKFMKSTEERMLQSDAAIKSLNLQVEFDSIEIVEDKFLDDCESMEEEFISLSNLLKLQHVLEENKDRLILDIPEEYLHELYYLHSYSNLDIVNFAVGDFRMKH